MIDENENFKGCIVFLPDYRNSALSRAIMLNPLQQVPNKGDRVIVSFQYRGASYSILFYANKEDGSTYKTLSWPKGLPDLVAGVEFTVMKCEVERI